MCNNFFLLLIIIIMFYFRQTSIYNIKNVKIHLNTGTKNIIKMNTILISNIVGLYSEKYQLGILSDKTI